MAEPTSSDVVILKILNGTQAGVEVSLVPGEYGLGTGPDDDIQLIDVSIRAGHARLRVSAAKIELAGAAGALRTAAGLVLEPHGTWQEIEPLDVVTAGSTRLALGRPTSQWATIIEDRGEPAPPREPARAGVASRERLRALAVPVGALVLLLAFAAWFVLGGTWRQLAGRDLNRDDLAVTRAALDEFPFGRPVAARREVDGTVYVSGYVETPVERRALNAALEKTGVPARVRLWVLQAIRSEVESLIASQKVPVTFRLSSDGELTLEGLILNEARADRFVELVRDRVVGLGEVRSRIRTAATLLTEVERLAAATQIQPFVLLRVNNDLIEATGAIPAAKVDAFVGFLQSYARRFARDIPLRSFVQLQGVNEGSTRSLMIGGEGGDVSLSPEQLASGAYKISDIFPDASRPTGPAGAAPAGGPSARPTAPRAPGDGAAAARGASDGASARTASDGAVALRGAGAAGDLTEQGRQLLERWRSRQLGGDVKSRALQGALEALRGTDPGAGADAVLPGWYLPMLGGLGEAGDAACWPDALARARDTIPALFWLDLISTNEGVSLADFGREQQLLLLDVALSPKRAAECAARIPEGGNVVAHSIYLREIRRNPGFIRFVVRDLPPFALDITGANLMQARFILTRGGRRMFEGSAPDQSSRVAIIGELGVAVQVRGGLSAVVFEPDMSWKITQ